MAVPLLIGPRVQLRPFEPEDTPANLSFAVETRRGRKLMGSSGLHSINWAYRRATTGG
jgi:hypothetical protein